MSDKEPEQELRLFDVESAQALLDLVAKLETLRGSVVAEPLTPKTAIRVVEALDAEAGRAAIEIKRLDSLVKALSLHVATKP